MQTKLIDLKSRLAQIKVVPTNKVEYHGFAFGSHWFVVNDARTTAVYSYSPAKGWRYEQVMPLGLCSVSLVDLAVIATPTKVTDKYILGSVQADEMNVWLVYIVVDDFLYAVKVVNSPTNARIAMGMDLAQAQSLGKIPETLRDGWLI